MKISVNCSYVGAEAGTAARPFRTIAAAMNRAVPGDTVVVASGLYRERVSLKSRVKLVSQKIGAAVLHGGANRSGGCATVDGADQAELRGFAIVGGYNGIRCDGTSPTITRNIILSNYGDGGVVCLNNSRALIKNNTILGQLGSRSNPRPNGIYAENSAPTIISNIITGNHTGLAPYRCRPAETYNDIWGNRCDFGYSAVPGRGTISVDPLFAYTVNNSAHRVNDGDYRLAAESPCRRAGDPRLAYRNSDGTRNDMGAFDGNGGYSLSLPAQDYFIESVLNAMDFPDGLRINGTSRFTADPVFWFDASGRGRQGESDARDALTRAIPRLTDNRSRAVFRDEPQPPADRCSFVTVIFDSPSGVAFRQGCDAGCGDPGFAAERTGAPICGGELHLSADWKDGFASDGQKVQTLIHELGHVGGLFHAFRGNRMIGYEGMCGILDDYTPVEKEAFRLLYSRPTGTTLGALIGDGTISAISQHPFPIIDRFYVEIDTPGWPWNETTSARAGDSLMIEGSRLTLQWCNEANQGPASRPPDYAPPVIYFGDTAVTPDLGHQFPINGGPSRYPQIRVPDGLPEGWMCVYLKVRGLESNPLYLEIVR